MEPMPDRSAWAGWFVTAEVTAAFRRSLDEQPDRAGCRLRSGCEAPPQDRRVSIALRCR
jgi:hypothetical protein